MCGIMGYYCFGKKTPDKDKITEMFRKLENRGRDASGFAFINEKNNLVVYKVPVPSSELVKTNDWKELELPRVFIAHARAKTQGSEKCDANNHPLYNKYGLCIVHNGMILNDDEIFIRGKRDGEVDSEAILAVLSSKRKGDPIKKVFDTLDGSFSFALIDKNEPDKLVLVKKDNPLELYFDVENDILYFCSTKDIMREGLGVKQVTKRGFSIGDGQYHHFTLENNHSLIINSDGVESYKRYSPKKDYYPYRNYGTCEYPNPAKDFDWIECPFCLGVTLYNPDKPVNKCECCGMRLAEEDLYV